MLPAIANRDKLACLVIRVLRFNDLCDRLADHEVTGCQPVCVDRAVLHHIAVVGIERQPQRARQKLPDSRHRNRRLIGSEILWNRQSLRTACKQNAVITLNHANVSQLSQHEIGSRDLEFPRSLNIDVLGDPVLRDDRETLAAHTHAESARVEFQTQCPRIIAIAVG